MDKPIIRDIPGGKDYSFELAGYCFVYQLRGLSRGRFGLCAELDACCYASIVAVGNESVGVMGAMSPVTAITVNLSSTRSRKDTVNYLSGQWLKTLEYTPPFQEMWDIVCLYAVKDYRYGDASEWLSEPEELNLDVKYLLKPLLYQNLPAVIFGEWGAGKSYLAMALAYIIQLPYYDNELGLVTKGEPTNTLYIDYELEKENFWQCWGQVIRGFGRGDARIAYRRQKARLIDAVGSIKQEIRDKNIGLVIIDNLSRAAGGNLNDTEPAMQYSDAISELGVTSLTLAHNSKDPLNTRKSIFGSVFFSTSARMIWECKKDQKLSTEDELVLGLKNLKASRSRLLKNPLGFKGTFANGVLSWETQEIEDTGEADVIKNPARIQNLLSKGNMLNLDIAETLGISPDVVKTTCNRLKDRGIVYKDDEGLWGLASSR